MVTSVACPGFYATVEAFWCTEFGCAVRSALLAEFQAHLSFFCWPLFKCSVIFLKPICQRDRRMACCSPRGLLLPAGLAEGLLLCGGAAQLAPGWGFPCEPLSSPRFRSAIPSQRFLLGVRSTSWTFGSSALPAERRSESRGAAAAGCPASSAAAGQGFAPPTRPPSSSCGQKSCVAVAVLYLFVACFVTRATSLSYRWSYAVHSECWHFCYVPLV